MLYLDYAKNMGNGYILNFFADEISDIAEVSNGKKFVTKNGTDYGAPLPSSTIVITMPDKTKKTYILGENGEWAEGGAGGGLSVQADWAQNDETAADHIKNRPFYEESNTTEIVDFKVVSGNLKEEGSEVTVEYNGKRYTGTVEVHSGNYILNIEGSDFKCGFNIAADETIFVIYHKKEYGIKADDEVIFNGAKYIVQTISSGDAAGVRYISDGEVDFESLTTITASFVYLFEGASVNGFLLDECTIFNSTTNVDFNIKAIQTTLKTIDPKFIKDIYYSTQNLTSLIDFKVISGDINVIGSTMVVQYNGKEYTETVKDAAGSGSSEHKPYIGFKFGPGEETPTEEHPFCYGVDFLFKTNEVQLFCAPKAVSEGQTVICNGDKNIVKKITIDGISILYVGNFHLINAEFEDTGEQYLTVFDYIKIESQGALDLMASLVPQDGISSEISDEKINYIDPKYIKDMYYETTTENQLFNGVVDINTEEQFSGQTYYTGTLSPSFAVGIAGDKCEVSIDGSTYTLDVITVQGNSFAGTQDFSNGIPVYVETIADVTTIGSKTSFTGANVSIKNIRTNTKQIPTKYIPQSGEVVEITVSDDKDTTIATALETYLKANLDVANRLATANAFTLKIIQDSVEAIYNFTVNYTIPFLKVLYGNCFTCTLIEEDLFSGNRCLKNKVVYIKPDGSAGFKTYVIYDDNLYFGVPDRTKLNLDVDNADEGKLAFYKKTEMAVVSVSDTVSLPEWINLAQQRDDFTIPVPSKDTDLVDKKYVDAAISGAITKTLNMEV